MEKAASFACAHGNCQCESARRRAAQGRLMGSGDRPDAVLHLRSGVGRLRNPGYYGRINLPAEPFNFPPPVLSIQGSPDQPTRHLALGEFSELSLDRRDDL